MVDEYAQIVAQIKADRTEYMARWPGLRDEIATAVS